MNPLLRRLCSIPVRLTPALSQGERAPNLEPARTVPLPPERVRSQGQGEGPSGRFPYSSGVQVTASSAVRPGSR